METFISDIKNKFLYGDTLTRLILINVGVFVVIAIIKVFFILLGLTDNATWNHNFEWSWNLEDFLARPWTIATYMFTSYGVWHLLFNMLTLYWFGQRFQTLFTNSQLRGIYILGALAGMVFFTLIFNLFPAMQTKDYLWTMPGTSTAVIAIASATAFRAPNHLQKIPLIGFIPAKYPAIALAIVNIALIPNINPATDFAHLGAGLLGFLFVYFHRHGTDITKPITSIAVWIDKLFDRKSNK